MVKEILDRLTDLLYFLIINNDFIVLDGYSKILLLKMYKCNRIPIPNNIVYFETTEKYQYFQYQVKAYSKNPYFTQLILISVNRITTQEETKMNEH